MCTKLFARLGAVSGMAGIGSVCVPLHVASELVHAVVCVVELVVVVVVVCEVALVVVVVVHSNWTMFRSCKKICFATRGMLNPAHNNKTTNVQKHLLPVTSSSAFVFAPSAPLTRAIATAT